MFPDCVSQVLSFIFSLAPCEVTGYSFNSCQLPFSIQRVHLFKLMLGQLLSTEKLTFVAKNRYNVLGWLPTNLNWYRVLSFSEWAFLKNYYNILETN